MGKNSDITKANRNSRMREFYLKNKDKIKERTKSYYLKNRDKMLAAQQKWRDENPEKIRTAYKIWNSKPENKKRRSEWHKTYFQKNKESYRLRSLKSYHKDIHKSRRVTNLRRKEHKMAAIKLLGDRCHRCHVKYDTISVYDFHHVNGTKEASLHRILLGSWSAIEKELTKCILLCSNCHRIVHNEEKTINE